jgi:hypothetical protein
VATVAVLLLQASWCAVARARHHHDPDPWRGPRLLVPGRVDTAQGGTPAMITVNSFEKGGDGGDPSECDGHYHSNKDLITALSTGWYATGKRCFKPIRISSTQTGRSVVARVVDECDSHRGCREQHRRHVPGRLGRARARLQHRRGSRHLVRRLIECAWPSSPGKGRQGCVCHACVPREFDVVFVLVCHAPCYANDDLGLV